MTIRLNISTTRPSLCNHIHCKKCPTTVKWCSLRSERFSHTSKIIIIDLVLSLRYMQRVFVLCRRAIIVLYHSRFNYLCMLINNYVPDNFIIFLCIMHMDILSSAHRHSFSYPVYRNHVIPFTGSIINYE